MNMIAAGAYLKALRVRSGLSQGKLAEQVGVAGNTIWRIEAGKQEPGGGQLAALLTMLHGRIEDFWTLFHDQTATLDDAENLAAQALIDVINDAPPGEREKRRQRAIAMIDELLADPRKIDRLLGYGERLQEE